jgi:hypothetical protein
MSRDQWNISGASAFSAYNTIGTVTRGAARIINPDYLAYIPGTDPVFSGPAYSRPETITTTGSGTIAISAVDSLFQQVTVSANTPTTINLAVAGDEGSRMTLAVTNSSGATPDINLGTGFTGINLTAPANGSRNNAIFERRGVTYRQVTPWVVV